MTDSSTDQKNGTLLQYTLTNWNRIEYLTVESKSDSEVGNGKHENLKKNNEQVQCSIKMI